MNDKGWNVEDVARNVWVITGHPYISWDHASPEYKKQFYDTANAIIMYADIKLTLDDETYDALMDKFKEPGQSYLRFRDPKTEGKFVTVMLENTYPNGVKRIFNLEVTKKECEKLLQNIKEFGVFSQKVADYLTEIQLGDK